MRYSLLLGLLAAAACLAHAGADSTAPAPRRSLTVDLPPTDPRSDLDWCWESLLTLGLWCKHDLLAGRPAPRACCRAADEAFHHHCGPLTRAFLGSLLPLGPLAQCAHPVVTGAPAVTRRPGARAPPRAPTLETGGARVSGGAPPPAPEARTGAFSPPPRAPTGASSGTPPAPKPEISARLPPVPAAPPRIPSGTPKRPPRSSVYIPPPEAPTPSASGAQGSPGPKPQTTTGAPALPDAYGVGAGTPLAAAGAAPPPQRGLPVE